MNSQDKKARILIIEDSDAIQKLTKQILTFRKEYDVVFADNGQIGLNTIINSEPFDIVLIDIQMPVMTGDECIGRIRALDDAKKANVPVIVCSGNPKEYTPEDFAEMGFTDSFEKPIEYPHLIEKIQSILKKVGRY